MSKQLKLLLATAGNSIIGVPLYYLSRLPISARTSEFDLLVRDILFVWSLILFSIALVNGVDYIIGRAIERVGELQIEWYAPQLQYAKTVSFLRPDQIHILEKGVPMRIKPRGAKEGKLEWAIVTPITDLPLWWFYEFLDDCEKEFPEIPKQHGLSDNEDRLRIRAFTKMVSNPEWGIAEDARGNQRAKWLLPSMEAVRAALGADF